MAKKIGASFSSELQAAGLFGLPFSWGEDGTFQFDPQMTQAQIAVVQVVFSAHDPTKPAPLPPFVILLNAALADPVIPPSLKSVLAVWKTQLTTHPSLPAI